MHFWTLCVPCMTGAPSLSLVCFRGHTLECMLHNELFMPLHLSYGSLRWV